MKSISLGCPEARNGVFLTFLDQHVPFMQVHYFDSADKAGGWNCQRTFVTLSYSADYIITIHGVPSSAKLICCSDTVGHLGEVNLEHSGGCIGQGLTEAAVEGTRLTGQEAGLCSRRRFCRL